MSMFYLFCYFLAHVLAETFYIQIHLCPAWEEKEMLQIKDIKEKKENGLRIIFFFQKQYPEKDLYALIRFFILKYYYHLFKFVHNIFKRISDSAESVCVNIISQKADFIMENLRKNHELELVNPALPQCLNFWSSLA